jgi:N utilization substance protein B
MDYNPEDMGFEEEQPRSARRRARELAVQGIYQHLFNKSDFGFILASLENLPEFTKSDVKHFNRLLAGILEEQESLNQYFSNYLDRDMSNVSPIEHAVLLIGTYELLHCLDIPYKVIINEAVELTKRFGGIDGYKYINGILDKIAPSLRPHG